VERASFLLIIGHTRKEVSIIVATTATSWAEAIMEKEGLILESVRPTSGERVYRKEYY
jgi:hypothetical protein